MSNVSWSLDSKGRMVLGAGVNWDEAEVRREIRADARVLAKCLGRPVTIVDPSDPMPWRVAEVVTP